MLLAVESDGRPIETQEREKIFEPFYQSENTRPRLSSSKGVGIGLAYSRKLALLHNGSLSLDDSYENGNAFILTIPLNQAGPLSAEKMESTSLEDAAPADSGRHTLLIVEDDIDLNNLLKKELSDVYNIYQASDGKEAVEVLKKYPVDMVISDIVMPEMDGCQLCDYIKTNVEFSHIPVLLLTAVDDADAQLMSLQSGADYYLTKPFSMSVLKASVSNLFRRKELMSRQFSTKPFGSPSGAADGQENEFMKKLYDTVMDNIANPQFSVIDLADQMSMSRSTLFRKIKANTGQNVNEYIKIVRLKKAAELLATKKYRIKEVSYMVGFSSSSYFSREFYRQFNTQPSSIFDAENPENNTSG